MELSRTRRTIEHPVPILHMAVLMFALVAAPAD
jgi:hypothetical protein